MTKLTKCVIIYHRFTKLQRNFEQTRALSCLNTGDLQVISAHIFKQVAFFSLEDAIFVIRWLFLSNQRYEPRFHRTDKTKLVVSLIPFRLIISKIQFLLSVACSRLTLIVRPSESSTYNLMTEDQNTLQDRKRQAKIMNRCKRGPNLP